MPPVKVNNVLREANRLKSKITSLSIVPQLEAGTGGVHKASIVTAIEACLAYWLFGARACTFQAACP